MKQNFIKLAVVTLVFASSMAVSVSTTLAACSYPGYINSSGQCIVPYQTYPITYTYTYDTALLQQYIAQLQILLAQLEALESTTPITTSGSNAEVTTHNASAVEDDQATLRGEIDFNSEDELTLYFEWGTSASSLTRATTQVVVDESDEVDNFQARLANLNEDQTYYFRAVARDNDGGYDYGSILNFKTAGDNHQNNESQLPQVWTDDADNINDDTARISGEIDMNDFDNGYAFFIYGEDEDQLNDVTDDFNNYTDIDEDGEDLQKISVDSNVDDDFQMWAELSHLDNDTVIFYTACVYFEDEDDDDLIICGDTESFTTDQD